MDAVGESKHTQTVSKRLQVILSDSEYRAVETAAARRGTPIASVVRESLRRYIEADFLEDPSARLASVLRFARFSGPTGDVEQLLEEIERGRNAP
jgi:hypothetical protein